MRLASTLSNLFTLFREAYEVHSIGGRLGYFCNRTRVCSQAELGTLVLRLGVDMRLRKNLTQFDYSLWHFTRAEESLFTLSPSELFIYAQLVREALS